MGSDPIASTSNGASHLDTADSALNRVETAQRPIEVSLLKRKDTVRSASAHVANANGTGDAGRDESNGTDDKTRLETGLEDLSLLSNTTGEGESGGHALDHPPLPPLDPVLQTALANQRDRLLLLKTEQELERFMATPTMTRLPMAPPYFPHMLNSYQRLLVHRLADVFGIHREVEALSMPTAAGQTGVVVLVKGEVARLYVLYIIDKNDVEALDRPHHRLSTYLAAAEVSSNNGVSSSDSPPEHLAPSTSSSASNLASETSDSAPSPMFKILPRERVHRATSSSASSSNHGDDERKKALTLEEREAAYREARERIFKQQEREAIGESITRPQSASSSVSRRSVASTVSSSRANPFDYHYHHYQQQPYLSPQHYSPVPSPHHAYGQFEHQQQQQPYFGVTDSAYGGAPYGMPQRQENWYAQRWVESPNAYYGIEGGIAPPYGPPPAHHLRHTLSHGAFAAPSRTGSDTLSFTTSRHVHASSSTSSLSAVSDFAGTPPSYARPFARSPAPTTLSSEGGPSSSRRASEVSRANTEDSQTSSKEEPAHISASVKSNGSKDDKPGKVTSAAAKERASLPAKPEWAANVTAQALRTNQARAAVPTPISSPQHATEAQRPAGPPTATLSYANATAARSVNPPASNAWFRDAPPVAYDPYQSQQPPWPGPQGALYQSYPGTSFYPPQQLQDGFVYPVPARPPVFDPLASPPSWPEPASARPFVDDLPRPPPREAKLFDPNEDRPSSGAVKSTSGSRQASPLLPSVAGEGSQKQASSASLHRSSSANR